MTTSPKTTIDHRAEAIRETNAALPHVGEDALEIRAAVRGSLQAAQVHATLALEAQTARLADEARTANQIAYLGWLTTLGPGEKLTAEGLATVRALVPLVDARLDLLAVSE